MASSSTVGFFSFVTVVTRFWGITSGVEGAELELEDDGVAGKGSHESGATSNVVSAIFNMPQWFGGLSKAT